MAATRTSVFELADWFGLNRALRTLVRRRVTILCYHGVVPDGFHHPAYLYRTALPVSEFRTQLRLIRRYYQPISATQLLEAIRSDDKLPDFALLVTFDDGYRNNLTLAAAELEAAGVPALFHVATGFIGKDVPLWGIELDRTVLAWSDERFPLPDGSMLTVTSRLEARCRLAQRVRSLCKELPDESRRSYLELLRGRGFGLAFPDRHRDEFLDWSDVIELHRRGFEIGAHTVTHPVLSRLPLDALRRELLVSKATIEQALGKPCPWLALPNGKPVDADRTVLETARECGFEAVFTTTPGYFGRGDDPLAIPRVGVGAAMSPSAFLSHTSGLRVLLLRGLLPGGERDFRRGVV